MDEFTKTIKLHIHVDSDTEDLFRKLTNQYSKACDYVSKYVFDNGFILNFMKLQEALYYDVREKYGLKSQFAISTLKTVTARYKTVKEQLYQNPYKYKDGNDKYVYITRTLEWLTKPIRFRRSQADLVRGRDYSFVNNGTMISINTLEKRVKVSFDIPDVFKDYFNNTWSFGTAKLVSLNKKWYLHIPVTKKNQNIFDHSMPKHVVGIDRGLRFLVTAYDETGKCLFFSGKEVLKKHKTFADVRAQLQAKGTKSAKRTLKVISGRENRWMADINHQLSKALVRCYGPDTLFVIEDLAGVSFDEKNLSSKSKNQRREIRSWSFYQFEQFLNYKTAETGSMVLKVPADYTSQRCPKCGRIHKENRDHEKHEYICDSCGYRSNDDRIGAMNLYELGTMYVSGDTNPRFGSRKLN